MKKSHFNWQDPLLLESELTEDERLIQDTAHQFCQSQLLPNVVAANRAGTFDRSIMSEFGKLGLLGATLANHQSPGVSDVAYGLIAREV